MRRHVVLTHLGWPAKRFIYATGQEAMWLAGGAFVALLLWRRLLSLCVVAPSDTAVPPLLVWGQTHLPAFLADPLALYLGWIPLGGAGLVLGLVALCVLWEPEGKKLHRWALVSLRTRLRSPRVATYQPHPERSRR